MITMNLTKEDKEIVKRAKREQFWKLLTDYIQVKKEETKAGIVTGLDPSMSKPIRNNRDILIFKMALLDEILNYPDEIINLIDNQEFIDQ